MSTLLAVMTYAKGGDTLLRHWPYFMQQRADYNYVIITEGRGCVAPPNANVISVGADSYINGPHLPNRMLDVIERLLLVPWSVLILTEYDTLFINRIRVEELGNFPIASHYAGGETWGSKAKGFYHNPWVFQRDAARFFLSKGRDAVNEGVCGQRDDKSHGKPEASPDVFVGYVCGKHNIPIKENLWKEYSRNSFDIPGHLDEAKLAYRNGYDIIHGIKTKQEFDYITK